MVTSPTWTPVPESEVIIHPNYQSGKIRIDVGADDESNAGVRFLRFKMNDSDSSNKDINLSIEESEYDEAAIIQALADQYGVPVVQFAQCYWRLSGIIFRRHLMYICISKRPAKRTLPLL